MKRKREYRIRTERQRQSDFITIIYDASVQYVEIGGQFVEIKYARCITFTRGMHACAEQCVNDLTQRFMSESDGTFVAIRLCNLKLDKLASVLYFKSIHLGNRHHLKAPELMESLNYSLWDRQTAG